MMNYVFRSQKKYIASTLENCSRYIKEHLINILKLLTRSSRFNLLAKLLSLDITLKYITISQPL